MLVSRSLLKQQGGCGESKPSAPSKPSGRAFRRKMLCTTIHRISESPTPASGSLGSCFQGLDFLFGRQSAKTIGDRESIECEKAVPTKIDTPLTDSDSETLSTMTRGTSCFSCTDCESLSA
ncbi:unnamed protein product [Durusdinium trenchii]|uniref:Uncharacterized protein n=2 Tax=Durusdinium trenchii TaxID=1381693 RepID=A0ABP0N2U7_9DINO